VYILPEDGHRSGPKHIVVVHNKIGHEKHLLRTVVLIKVLVDTRATGCITQQLSYAICFSLLGNPQANCSLAKTAALCIYCFNTYVVVIHHII
jgi:hypothetical protein